MKALFIVASSAAASYAGCRGPSTRHSEDTGIAFWWPELGTQRLRGLLPGMVVYDRVSLKPEEADFLGAMFHGRVPVVRL